ncbi:MAG: GHMP kinase [Acidobacteriota bacterium]|nr:GHMP kinase [Blastocatellia bacterium]MDW8411487.1 GHMP kinase [Acidobacteriota bacterium]
MIEALAPTRIDLAGGTVDIWPLYLFHPGARTINFAVDLFARCTIVERSDDVVVITSKDTSEVVETTLEGLEQEGRLELLVRLLKFFRPAVGLELTTDCAAPAGSGLGGSSALNVAVCSALNAFTLRGYSEQQLLTIAKNIETQVIRVPAGEQDYYPAMFGGVCSIQLEITGVTCKQLLIDSALLDSRFVLCYTGKPHFSGTNNWEIFKKYIDGDSEIRAHFTRIVDISLRMEQAVCSADIDAMAKLLDEEWQVRKKLASGVTTPMIERLVEVARASGALGAKVCGAGGGGCVVFIAAEGRKAELTAALLKAGGEVLDCRLQPKGVQVTSRAACE